MSDADQPKLFVFPRWSNLVIPALVLGAVAGMPYIVLLVGMIGAPSTLAVGYQPQQPIPYSHELHVNQLGLDCRYCHNTVETGAFAAIPPTATCMNCHHAVRTDSAVLKPLYESFRTGKPIHWTQVHDLPDYAYFNHSAHINKGVSCVSCHGRIDRMGGDGVYQHEELSMGWCLNCHRNPAPNLRPKNQVTNLMWGFDLTEDEAQQLRDLGLKDVKAGVDLTDEQRLEVGELMFKKHNVMDRHQMSDCSRCHR